MSQPILAAVDLGSNSFRLQIARVEGQQLYMLDGLRESVRLAAGLDEHNNLDEASQQRGLTALSKLAERLRGLPPEAVRAVATNAIRVANNAAEFLPRAEQILGYPIDIIAGYEEARLIYVGVAHGLAPSPDNRLVMDIGGGSTEFIIGNGFTPLKLESLHMGCVSYSLRFFSDGKITKQNMRQAELAARIELQAIANSYQGQWQHAYGSSGTAKILNEILLQNGFSQDGITREGLEKLRAYLLKVGDVNQLNLQGLRADRTPALAGGFAIMYAAFCSLNIDKMYPASGALREGVLYDLWGRAHDQDIRDITVHQFKQRYLVDENQVIRVSHLANQLARQLMGSCGCEADLHLFNYVTQLHEIGISIAHSGYHKHGAYILAHADMPGFSKTEQAQLSLITLAQRGGLVKVQNQLKHCKVQALVMSLRLAVLFYRCRCNAAVPDIKGSFNGNKFALTVDRNWLSQNPLTEAALQEEAKVWKQIGFSLQLE